MVDMDEVERLAQEHKPEADRRRLVGLPAPARLRRLPRDRRLGRRQADGRHGALRRPRRRRRAPNPVEHADVVTTTIHKTLCGPRSGMILCREEHAKAIDKAIFPGQQGGPLMHTIAAKAVALRIAASEPFRARQRQTIANAQAFAAGLEAGGVPVLTGGTDVHLVLVDLTPSGLDGKTAEDRLEEVGITVNRNAIPFDERPPMNPSGLRIGTPALTTRGLVEEDMTEIAAVIAAALAGDFEAEKASPARAHRALMERYPLYPEFGRGNCLTPLKIWVDMSAPAHVLVLRPIIERLRAAGPHGRGHLARLRADAGTARAARDGAHADRPPRRRLAGAQGAAPRRSHHGDDPLRPRPLLRPRPRPRLQRPGDRGARRSASPRRTCTTTSTRSPSTGSAAVSPSG